LSNLEGMWIAKDEENVSFVVDKKTFFYPEHAASYKYELVGDSVKIHYDGFNSTFGVKFKGNDTLFLNNHDFGESVFYRMK